LASKKRRADKERKAVLIATVRHAIGNAWGEAGSLLSASDLALKRIAARQCGLVCQTVSVAVDGGKSERRHYITDPQAVRYEPEAFSAAAGDPRWYQLPRSATAGMSAEDRADIEAGARV
jgi:hypothetical protein